MKNKQKKYATLKVWTEKSDKVPMWSSRDGENFPMFLRSSELRLIRSHLRTLPRESALFTIRFLL